MDSSLFATPNTPVHIVGIGGAGMSAIARVLIGRGLRVSGSDRGAGPAVQELAALGATVHVGHAADHVQAPAAVLISSAVKDDNPEVVAARAAGIPVLKRREALPHLLAGKTQIAVAGTHGKTTTTSMIAHILLATGRDPSYIVGGTLANTGDNARAGNGDAFVIEADEYDYMFLGLNPTIAVLTNVEHDHPDMFPTLDLVMYAFRQFIGLIPEYDGVLIACADDPNAAQLAREHRMIGQPTLTYGLKEGPNWYAEKRGVGQFTVHGVQDGKKVRRRASITLPGDHNIQNALAALAAAVAYGIPLPEAISALETFRGAGRRFEPVGTVNGVLYISDYGHHPTAIRATLQAGREAYPKARLWAVWQPHTYSRTRLLAAEFAESLRGADRALITDIYAAREVYQGGDPTAAGLAESARGAGVNATASGDLAATAALLRVEAQPGDVVIIFSAGDAPEIVGMVGG